MYRACMYRAKKNRRDDSAPHGHEERHVDDSTKKYARKSHLPASCSMRAVTPKNFRSEAWRHRAMHLGKKDVKRARCRKKQGAARGGRGGRRERRKRERRRRNKRKRKT